MEKAEEMELPSCAQHLLHPKVRLLVKMCFVLQQNAGDENFYLSSHVAGRLLGAPQRQAHRFLTLLCDKGILTVTEKGNPRVANRYRYKG
jgi:hypothetical protein